MDYASYVYIIVRNATKGLDSIYEDYIIKLVGLHGLNALIEDGFLETCGVINGRPLYVLCDAIVKVKK